MSAGREVHPKLAAARAIADDHLFPTAQDVDRSELIERSRFEPLADAGLFGIAAPPDAEEPALDVPTLRRTMAAVAGGCGVTFFCWAQHHGVVRTISGSENTQLRDRHLDALRTGERIGATAFAHLRRADRRAVTATRVADGWRLDGYAPWATSWGVADVFTIAAESDDGELVWTLLDGHERAGLVAESLPLPVFGATGTVALRFDGLVVPHDRTIAVEDAHRWRSADRQRASVGQTGILGVADRAIRLLAESARSDDDPAVAASVHLEAHLDELWRDDDAHLAALAASTVHEASVGEAIAAASDHRAACLGLGRRATSTLLAAVGGAGMNLAHPAQRLAREADFYVIQAQTTDGRAAVLRASSD